VPGGRLGHAPFAFSRAHLHEMSPQILVAARGAYDRTRLSVRESGFRLASRMAGTALVFVLHVFFARWAGPEGLRRIRLRDNLRDARETVRLARLPAGGAALPAFLPGPERLVANARPRARRRTPHADDGRHCHQAGPPRASTARRWKVWMHRRGASELHLRPSIVSALKPLPESRGTHA
jgi:hypothetical protein